MSKRPIGLSALLAGATLGTAVSLTAAPARADTPGCTAKGVLPAAFPAQLLVGVGSATPDDTKPLSAGNKWNVHWLYLSGQSGNDWYNGYGGSPADGSWIVDFFSTIDGQGLIPGIHLYNMGFGHSDGTGILTEIQSSTWTKAYFTEFKALMQRAKTFGKPVVIVLEGDSFGFLEMQTQNMPTTMAAVASTGMAEVAGLPNTIAGFGQALLAIRKSVGAYNVAMGPDVPYYAAQADIMNFTFDALQPHVDYQYAFFGPLGVGANVTGDTFDFMASAPDDADCASYLGAKPCWDASDTAPTTGEASINRYIQWLSLFNQTAGVHWMLHQVPIGNSQNRNVAYDGTAKSGYQDNRAEFLFQYETPASTALRDKHLTSMANAGVMGMLFGLSTDGDTAFTDIWKDGMPFLVTHVAAVGATGFAIARGPCSADGGAAGGSSSSGGVSADGGSSGASSSGGVSADGGSSGAGSSSGSTSSSGGSGSGSGGGALTDGGSQGDAGGFGGTTSAGCGCVVGEGAPATSGGAMSLLLLSSAWFRRRRRS